MNALLLSLETIPSCTKVCPMKISELELLHASDLSMFEIRL